MTGACDSLKREAPCAPHRGESSRLAHHMPSEAAAFGKTTGVANTIMPPQSITKVLATRTHLATPALPLFAARFLTQLWQPHCGLHGGGGGGSMPY